MLGVDGEYRTDFEIGSTFITEMGFNRYRGCKKRCELLFGFVSERF